MEIENPTNKKKKSTTMTSLNTNTITDIQNPSNEPTWKLYENPFYNSPQRNQNPQNQNPNLQSHQTQNCLTKNLQFLHLPLSARKLAASFWFFKPMDSSQADPEPRRSAELEIERKARKKLESANKRLAKELAEERRARETMQRMCEELAREVSADKAEMARLRREIEEERKMMRMSEVLREERVQMKLADAKIELEERLSELDLLHHNKRGNNNSNLSNKFRHFVLGEKIATVSTSTSSLGSDKSTVGVDSMESMRSVFSSNNSLSMSDHYDRRRFSKNDHNVNVVGASSLPIFQKKLVASESENPHIKRGIKGFVEFPRVVKSIGTRNRQWVTKLECQKAQLRILLKQKSPIRSSNNLVVS